MHGEATVRTPAQFVACIRRTDATLILDCALVHVAQQLGAEA
jgi:hypothetical protein